MEVDFGDAQLFEQFAGDAPANVNKHIRFSEEDEPRNHDSELRGRLEQSKEAVVRLEAENIFSFTAAKLISTLARTHSVRN